MEMLHNVIVENRERMSLSGVTDVEGFDEREIRLYTKLGDMRIVGKKLKVAAVDVTSGEMSITGEIKGLVWGDRDKTKKPGLLQKLTR